MACEANVKSSENLKGCLDSQTTTSESQRLNFIYDNEPLEFEKDPLETKKKMQVHNHL